MRRENGAVSEVLPWIMFVLGNLGIVLVFLVSTYHKVEVKNDAMMNTKVVVEQETINEDEGPPQYLGIANIEGTIASTQEFSTYSMNAWICCIIGIVAIGIAAFGVIVVFFL